jgi:hypothetical protein
MPTLPEARFWIASGADRTPRSRVLCFAFPQPRSGRSIAQVRLVVIPLGAFKEVIPPCLQEHYDIVQ